MRNATWDQRTVIQTFDPVDGDRYVTMLTLEAASVHAARLTIDGDRWLVFNRWVEINTSARAIVTTITVVKDS